MSRFRLPIHTFPLIVIITSLLSMPARATIYRTSQTPAQQVINNVQPGDAVVFDGESDGVTVTVNREIRDVQFIGGGAVWNVAGGLIEDCYFFWHHASVTQTGGRIRRSAFYKSIGTSHFTHVDSVSFYFSGDYIYSGYLGDRPKLTLSGFVRGAFIFKPYLNQLSYAKKNGEFAFDWEWPTSIVIDATDPVGNGWGTYIMSPVIWEQTNWRGFRVINGTGITFAHCNTEYNVWADPICEFSNATGCMALCNGIGSRGSFANPYRTPEVIQYADHRELGHNQVRQSYRGAAFVFAGQHNKVVASGSYKTWSGGRKPWIPGLHYADGAAARDPYFENWPGDGRGNLSVNFAEAKAAFTMDNDGNYALLGEQRYPLDGPDVIAPVVMAMPDIRAMPPAIRNKTLTDLSGRTGEQIAAVVNAGGNVYLGEGTYDFGTTSLSGGLVTGAGIGKTILQFADDAPGNTNSGFINVTVKGGRIGLQSNQGILGRTLMRVRFEGQSDICLLNGDGGCWQNDIVQGVEFADSRAAIAARGAHCAEPFKFDKVDILNCTFTNITEDACVLNDGGDQNGQCAVTNCHFENIGESAIKITGGQTHMVQACTFKECGSTASGYALIYLGGTKGAVSATYCDIENTSVTTSVPAIRLKGTGGVVSHCTISGVASALSLEAAMAVDHVTADGTIETANPALFIAKSSFSNIEVGINDNQVVIDPSFTKAEGFVVELDDTPPPDVDQASVSVERRSANDEWPYLAEYNYVTWNAVDDPESGINGYLIMAGGKEVGRTTARRETWNTLGEDGRKPAPTFFRDPDVSNGDYVVHPINGANLLPSGEQAVVRRFDPVRGLFLIDDGKEFRPHKMSYVASDNRPVEDTIRGISFNTRGSDNRLVKVDGSDAGNWPAMLTLDYGELASIHTPPSVRATPPTPLRSSSASAVLKSSYFYLPRAGKARVVLYDGLGRRLRVLYDGRAAKGSTALGLDRSTLSHGVYWLRMQAGGTTRSLAIVKVD